MPPMELIASRHQPVTARSGKAFVLLDKDAVSGCLCAFIQGGDQWYKVQL